MLVTTPSLRELFDVARRFGPLRRQRDQPNVTLGGILPAAEFFEIRRPDPARRMRAARTIVRRDVRTLDVKRFHRRTFGERLARPRQIAQRSQHVFRRSGDHGGKEARHAGRKHRADRTRDFFHRRRSGRIVIDTRESVHLQVDETRGDRRPRPPLRVAAGDRRG